MNWKHPFVYIGGACVLGIGLMVGYSTFRNKAEPEKRLEERVTEKTAIEKPQDFGMDFKTNDNYARAMGVIAQREREKGMKYGEAAKLYFSTVMDANNKDGVSPRELKAYMESQGCSDVEPADVKGRSLNYTSPTYAFESEADKARFDGLVDRWAKVHTAHVGREIKNDVPWQVYVRECVAQLYKAPEQNNAIVITGDAIDQFEQRVRKWEAKQ